LTAQRRLHRRLPRGLQWRLTAWVAAVLLVSAAAVLAVVYQETGEQLRTQIDREVSGDVNQFAQAVRAIDATDPSELVGPAQRYVDSQGYSASSRLLFASIPGYEAISNHPEVFGAAAKEPGESAAEQQRENAMGREVLASRPGFSVHPVADVGPVRVDTRVVAAGGVRVVVGAGESLALVERAQHGVARTFLLAGALILLLALIASYLAGAHVSAPLRQMALVAARVDGGELGPRMETDGSRAGEIQVLAESFNTMLDRLSEAFAAQREFVADASHELRTPLTVIRGQLEVLAAEAEPSVAEIQRVEHLVQAEVSRISRLVDDLLLLAQSERMDFLRMQSVELAPFIADLWEGLSHTADRIFELGPLPTGTLEADPDRLAQAVRNLVRNAIDHTAPGTGQVRLEVQRASSQEVRLAVVDDGPGIPAAERERVFERFHRTDASRARAQGGTGLGLAIVLAIVEAHGGQARALSGNGSGGARVELTLPRFRPS
jgi:two-component system, OmpR family, sensor kinase